MWPHVKLIPIKQVFVIFLEDSELNARYFFSSNPRLKHSGGN